MKGTIFTQNFSSPFNCKVKNHVDVLSDGGTGDYGAFFSIICVHWVFPSKIDR